jgi:hypothetical protein
VSPRGYRAQLGSCYDRFVSVLYEPGAWQPYLTVVAGAGATLCGLVFVGLALNLEPIKQSPALVGRAGEAVSLLLAALLCALVGLLPGVTARLAGGLLLVLGAAIWTWLVALQAAAYREQRQRYLHYFVVRVCLGQLATLPVLVGALGLRAGSGGGMAWVAGGLALFIVVGVFDAWVLAIEIVR